VSTKARLSATAVLAELRPRTALPALAGLADAAAVLVEAGQPTTVVVALFACLRLDRAELAKVLDVLVPDGGVA
jgi:hypothetical protein